jgi:outer membrane lipoprotein-sorting protein
MTDNEKEFENLVRDIRFDDSPALGHRDRLEEKLLSALDQTSRWKQSPLKIWRIIMKSRITKAVAAAAIIVAVALAITIINQTTAPVWAIEQSIEAASQYRGILVEGSDSERSWREDGSLELRPSKSWAAANDDQTMVEKYRHEVDGVPIITTNGKKTWRYDPQTNTVRVENRGYVASECWLGGPFLEQLKEARDAGIIQQWEPSYGKDPATGEERIFLACAWLDGRYNGPRSMRLAFDMESKLLVSFKQWENPNWEGPPTLIAERITYFVNLPDRLFEFEIPEGATVIEE